MFNNDATGIVFDKPNYPKSYPTQQNTGLQVFPTFY